MIVILFANTFVVSAWAQTHLNTDNNDISASSETMMHHADRDTPCQEQSKKDKKNDRNHCEGVCLCMHVSSHQSPITDTSSRLFFRTISSTQYDLIDDRFADISTALLKRPPRT